jgi:electron transfer flavoprotein alpha subunit
VINVFMGSKKTIAIHEDAETNIFGMVHSGIIGDYKNILSAFIDKCEGLSSE